MPCRWAIDVEYNGKGFVGSQIQCQSNSKSRLNNPEIRTVQAELEKALCTLIRKKTRTIFSGRTDAGVHACCQVVHFESELELDAGKVVNSLNALLPKDVSVKNLRKVEKSFHAQKSARWRWYRYVITNRAQRSVWDCSSLLVRSELNLENINKSLSYLRGEHDFSSFKCSRTDNPARVCNVVYANASKNKDIINIDIVADRFLYNMIRIIVGTVLMIENNSSNPSKMKEILESKNRSLAGQTVVPDGLYLMKVEYEMSEFDEVKFFGTDL